MSVEGAPSPLAALVVLGCRLPGESTRGGGAAMRRAQRAAEAFHAGLAPLVLACGGRRWSGVCEATWLRDGLVARGVPLEAILRECRSLTTAENAHHAAELLAERGARRVGIVTCDWHMRRALACFRAAGLEPASVQASSPAVPAWQRLRRSLAERIRTALGRSW